MHNPYVVRTGVFDWFGLEDKNPDMTDRILGLAGLRIELTWHDRHRLPDWLRPPGMPEEQACEPLTKQRLVIERSRHSIRGHGPRDSLTVTFSELVNRHDYDFQYAEEQGYPVDKEAVFAAMDHTQTWTDVKKIRLVRVEGERKRTYPEFSEFNAKYHMQLVRRGADGEEIVAISDAKLSCIRSLKDLIAQSKACHD
jgi:hypothetical protein